MESNWNRADGCTQEMYEGKLSGKNMAFFKYFTLIVSSISNDEKTGFFLNLLFYFFEIVKVF